MGLPRLDTGTRQNKTQSLLRDLSRSEDKTLICDRHNLQIKLVDSGKQLTVQPDLLDSQLEALFLGFGHEKG